METNNSFGLTLEAWELLKAFPRSSSWLVLSAAIEQFFYHTTPSLNRPIDSERLETLWVKLGLKETEQRNKKETSPEPLKEKRNKKEKENAFGGLKAKAGARAPMCEREEKEKTAFTPPTLQQVQLFVEQHHLGISPERFYDYYNSINWHIDGHPILSWQAMAQGWERNTAYYEQRTQRRRLREQELQRRRQQAALAEQVQARETRALLDRLEAQSRQAITYEQYVQLKDRASQGDQEAIAELNKNI